MKKRTLLLTLGIAGMLALSFVSAHHAFAQTQTRDQSNGYVLCGTKANPKECGFSDLVALVQTILNDAIFIYLPAISTLVFAYAGFLMVTAGGDTKQVDKAKKIFTNVALGYLIIVASFLVIKVIFSTIFGSNYTSLIS